MASEITARKTQARRAANQDRQLMLACTGLNPLAENFLPLVKIQRPYDRPDGQHTGMALTAGGGLGTTM